MISPCQLNATVREKIERAKPGGLTLYLLRRGGSNSRPLGYEPNELPLLYFAMWKAKVGLLGGFTKEKASRCTGRPDTTLYENGYPFTFEILLDPLLRISRITPSPLYRISLAPLACADNSLFTVTCISLAPDALAVQVSV